LTPQACVFSSLLRFWISLNTFQALLDSINAFYGLKLTANDVTELGKSVLKKEREFNAAAGFTSKHDDCQSISRKNLSRLTTSPLK